MGWQLYAENEDEKVLEKQRDDGGTEYLHFYKDESLAQEAAASRESVRTTTTSPSTLTAT
ncbi:MAG: hypothetical protein HXK97_02080 [Candidatus Nanogingivalaceae bacterium]|nr:hypothetical protein [Candidatus Nanogingivalaceae bacterium]